MGARYYDPTTGRFTIQDSVTGTQEDPMSLNRYIYARDNPMKIVDLAGHEWWNPISDITAAASAVTSAVSTAAGDVVSTVSGVANSVTATVADVAGAVSNAGSNIPPDALVTMAVVDIGAIAGSIVQPELAPSLLGAAFAATSYTLSAGKSATAEGVLTATVIGGLSGEASLLTSAFSTPATAILANAAIGGVTTFANQQANSFETTGHWAAVTPQSIEGDVLGGVISAGGAVLGNELEVAGGSAWSTTSLRSVAVTGGATTMATLGTTSTTGIPMTIGSPVGFYGYDEPVGCSDYC